MSTELIWALNQWALNQWALSHYECWAIMSAESMSVEFLSSQLSFYAIVRMKLLGNSGHLGFKRHPLELTAPLLRTALNPERFPNVLVSYRIALCRSRLQSNPTHEFCQHLRSFRGNQVLYLCFCKSLLLLQTTEENDRNLCPRFGQYNN